jgi:hypothetical protein
VAWELSAVTPDGSSDSVLVQVDSSSDEGWLEWHLPQDTSFTWGSTHPSASFVVDAGPHSLLIGEREDGVSFDRVRFALGENECEFVTNADGSGQPLDLHVDLDLDLGEEPMCSVVGPGYQCGEYGCDVNDCCLANLDGTRKACCTPVHCDDNGDDVRGQTITCGGVLCQVPPNHQYASIGFDAVSPTTIAGSEGIITSVTGTASECEAQCSSISACRAFLRGFAADPDASEMCWLRDRALSGSTYSWHDHLAAFFPPSSYGVHQKFDVRRGAIWSNAVDGAASATFGFSGFGHLSGYQQSAGVFACEPDAYPTPGENHQAQTGVTCAAGGPCEVGDVRLSNVAQDSGSGRAIGIPEIMTQHATWSPICGHYMWDSDRGAELLCQRMGFRRGALFAGEAFSYSADAYRLGLCLASDESLMSCTGGCNDYTDSGHCQVSGHAAVYCSAGEPVGVRIVCEGVQPMFLRVWLK